MSLETKCNKSFFAHILVKTGSITSNYDQHDQQLILQISRNTFHQLKRIIFFDIFCFLMVNGKWLPIL